MRPVSAAFLKAVSSSHQMNSRARVLTVPGQHGTDPDGTFIPLTDGGVTFDSTADVQGTLDLTTSYAWPASANDLITPYGNEIFVERGVVFGGGATEWVSLGYYRIDQPEQQNAPKGTIAITGSDRMQGIIDARLPQPQTFTSGTAVMDVIRALVLDVYPWAEFDYDASLDTRSLTADQTTTDDRYKFLTDLITAHGMVWRWDYRGLVWIHPVPDPTVPVATVKTGPGGVATQLSRTLTRTGIYNGAVAIGQQAGSSQPVYAVVVDNNPASPTYWYGKFGKVPQFFNSSFLVNSDQCVNSAVNMLLKSTGLPYEMDFAAIPNPALELYDAVRTEPGGRVENHVLKQLKIGLKATDTMTSQTRQLLNAQFQVVAQS